MSSETSPEPNETPPHATHFWGRVMRYFLTGVVAAGPIALTLFLAWWVIGLVDQWVKPWIPHGFNPDEYLPFALPGLGLLLAFVGLVVIGFLTTNLVGRSAMRLGEAVLSRVPVLSTVYGALRQIFETVVNQGSKNFRQVGLVEFPRRGLWALVFISAPAKGEIAEKAEGEDIISCFMPTTPNPTSGFLIFVPRNDVTILDMTIEEAAKVVISAGLVMPEYQKRLAAMAAEARSSGENTPHRPTPPG
jgi:uncharacterized membrane protein